MNINYKTLGVKKETLVDLYLSMLKPRVIEEKMLLTRPLREYIT